MVDPEDETITDLASRAAGADDDDPYADVDVETLPSWLREAVAEHERFGLRPYRPPEFADGTRKREVVERVEDRFDVDVSLVNTDVSDDDWEVRVDGRVAGTVRRRRVPGGFSVFDVSPDAFVELVRRHVDGR